MRLLPLLLLAIAPAAFAAEPLTFEGHVRPLLKAYCFDCHGDGEKPKGGLDVRLRRTLVRGGKGGPAVVPGDAAASPLLERVRTGEMPPSKKKLSPEQVDLLTRWVAAGAPTARPEPETLAAGFQFTPEERAFWSFQPVRRPAPPAVRDVGRIRTPVDAFLLAALESTGRTFSPEAERLTLIRRVTLDLLGLPPSPEEVDAFLADTEPHAYERLVDRLLASPHYGERWGRHWLDAAGYADSDGATPEDPVRPYAYKYRDYVIRSLNADKPCDRFLVEQLAGDELVPPPHANLTPEAAELLTATGFLRMAPDGSGAPGADIGTRNQAVAESLKVVSTAILGLTVGCAQCHNHRHDPIPQVDYYRFRAVFEPALDPKNWKPPRARLVSLWTDADRRRAAEVEKEAAAVEAERLKKQEAYIERTVVKELEKVPEVSREAVRAARNTPAAKRTPEQQQLLKAHPSVNVSAGSLYLYDRKAADELKAIADRAAEVRKQKPPEDFVHALAEPPGAGPSTHVFFRGDHQQPREAVTPASLSILPPVALPVDDPALPTTGRRLAFVRHLTDGRHPLTARVLVNRLWHHHFGRGLVATPGDFGSLGARPTHPELLDWLADELVASGWQLKRLHKLLLTSTAYRQSSRRPETDTDPDNRLLGRFAVRRLEAEAVRDAMLVVCGKLNRKLHGVPVPVMEDEVGQFVVGIENKNGENRPGPVIPLHGEEFRRSLYVQARRTRPLAVLDAFDLPVLEPNCDARSASTVATQSLWSMNGEFVLTAADHFAERLRRESPHLRTQVATAWRLAYGRFPDEAELREALRFLREQGAVFTQAKATEPDRRALANLCQALLGSNEFLYVD